MNEVNIMENVKNFNNQSGREEIANAITHGIGTLLAVAGTVVLIVRAALHSGPIGVVSACLYGASMILLYLFSTLYHSLVPYKAKRVFQVFDHCSIFLLILGTYIPICLNLIGGWFGWTMFGVIAASAVTGITLNAINLHRWHKISLVLYVMMGWISLLSLKWLFAAAPVSGILIYLVGGGALYTAGIKFYRDEKHRFAHALWHLFVLAGTVLHYFFILLYVYPVV